MGKGSAIHRGTIPRALMQDAAFGSSLSESRSKSEGKMGWRSRGSLETLEDSRMKAGDRKGHARHINKGTGRTGGL